MGTDDFYRSSIRKNVNFSNHNKVYYIPPPQLTRKKRSEKISGLQLLFNLVIRGTKKMNK